MRAFKPTVLPLAAVLLVLASIGCSRTIAYKDNVRKALTRANYTNLFISEDVRRNTITLSGKVESENARQRAVEAAKSAAGERIVANEISVDPLGIQSEARKYREQSDRWD
ncbi:MAG TPA: BON domain-containing protein [Terriglobales bacterium]|jgi:osmotically-inducible protein OsmY|nr:BON domain-containing protein [Terriglobales bacterium]